MKRALAMAAMLASAAAMSSPALAAGTPQYGSVKLQWNVAVAMTATVHTTYSGGVALANNAGATPVIDESGTGGSCTPTGANADLTIDFGTIVPSLSNAVACNYNNALGIAYTTNDSSGVKGYEYLDAALPTGLNLCAFPNTAAAFPISAPTATATATTHHASIPAAYSAGACAAGGAEVKNGGGTVNNSGGGPGPAGGTLAAAPATSEYESGATTTVNWISTTAAAGTAVDSTEDLQLNVGTTASSGAANVIMTVEMIPN